MSLVVQSVALALMLLVLSAAAAVAADADTERLQRELISPWIVTVQGEARARSLQIRGAERKSNDVWTLDATYDWLYTEKPPSVRAELTLASNGYKLELITRANSLIVAESTDLTVFRGTFRPTSGAAKQVTIEKVSADELSKRRQPAFAQLFVQPGPAVPATAQVEGETVWIRMQDKVLFVSREIRLEATLYKPKGIGPFPVVVFNHGSTGPGVIPASSTSNPRGYASYLLKQGIALIIPMRRGRGKSEGLYTEPYDCSLNQAQWGIQYAMESLDAVYEYLRKQEWADMHRVILSGTSRGGLLSVVYAAERPGSAIGVINFVGGWMSDSCNSRAGLDINEAIFREAGKKSAVPALFLYGSADNYYAVSSIEKYPVAFREGGGRADYRLYTLPAGENGHALLYRHEKLWRPEVDAFLLELGMMNP